MLIFSYVIRNEHRKCLKQIALSTPGKYFETIQYIAGEISTSLKTFIAAKRKETHW